MHVIKSPTTLYDNEDVIPSLETTFLFVEHNTMCQKRFQDTIDWMTHSDANYQMWNTVFLCPLKVCKFSC